MRRFLAFWIVLTPACWLTMGAVSYFGFRHIDLTYYTFAVMVTAPVLQALVLSAATSSRRAGQVPIGVTLRDPLVVPVLLLDLVLLGAGWLWMDTPLIGLAGRASIQPAWLGTKAAAAGVFLLSLAARRRLALRPRPAVDGAAWAARAWLVVGAAAFVGVGLQAFVPWIEQAIAGLLPWNIGKWPTLFRWLAAYGTTFVAMNGLILVIGGVLRRRAEDADFWMQTAVAFNFGAGLIVVLGFFRLPYLVYPWYGLAWTAGSLAASSALLGAIRAFGGQAGERSAGR